MMATQDRPRSHRPSLDLTAASSFLERHYGLQAASIRELESFADRNFEVTTNLPVSVGSGNGLDDKQLNHFILKIYNSKDSIDGNRIELAVSTMEYLWKKGFCCPVPVPNVDGKLIQCERTSCEEAETNEGKFQSLFMVVLLTYLPGRTLTSLAPAPAEVLYDVGKHLAHFHLLLKENTNGIEGDQILQRLVKDFKDYNHTRPSTYCSGEWSLVKLPTQRRLLTLVDDGELRRDVEKAMDMFEEHVVPVLPKFREGIIHGDFNDQNIIVAQHQADTLIQSWSKPSEGYGVTGIIDFGEVAYTCIVFDIAIAMNEVMMMRADDHMGSAAHIIEGYQSVEEIPNVEKEALYHLVLARYAQHILLSLETREKDPDNDYIMAYFGDCCTQLRNLLSIPKCDADKRWNLY